MNHHDKDNFRLVGFKHESPSDSGKCFQSERLGGRKDFLENAFFPSIRANMMTASLLFNLF
jgi:hypothetical protein